MPDQSPVPQLDHAKISAVDLVYFCGILGFCVIHCSRCIWTLACSRLLRFLSQRLSRFISIASSKAFILGTLRLFPCCKTQAYRSLVWLALACLHPKMRYSYPFGFWLGATLTTSLEACCILGRRSGQVVSPNICLRITAI